MIRIVLIGGSNNGRRMTLNELRPIELPVLPALTLDMNSPALCAPIERESYKPMEIKGHYKSFTVYHLDGMSPDEVIHALIEDYGRES